MIDPAVFAEEWAILDDRFPGERSEKVGDRYYTYLSEQMDTETFVASAERIFSEREHFPRPVDFLEAVGGGVEDRAGEWWPEVMKAVRAWSPYKVYSGDESYYRHERLVENLPEDVREAVRRLGGLGELSRLDEGELWWRRKEFAVLLRHVSVSEGRKALAPATEKGKRLIEAAVKGRSADHLRLIGGDEVADGGGA